MEKKNLNNFKESKRKKETKTEETTKKEIVKWWIKHTMLY